MYEKSLSRLPHPPGLPLPEVEGGGVGGDVVYGVDDSLLPSPRWERGRG